MKSWQYGTALTCFLFIGFTQTEASTEICSMVLGLDKKIPDAVSSQAFLASSLRACEEECLNSPDCYAVEFRSNLCIWVGQGVTLINRPGTDTSEKVCSAGPSLPAVPQNVSCAVHKQFNSEGDIVVVEINCESEYNDPDVLCEFYRVTNGGDPVALNADISYSHEDWNSEYRYKTRCVTSELVADLGEGDHTFEVFVYPNVTDGKTLVNATAPLAIISLFPTTVDHVCPDNMLNSYLCGYPLVCNCTVVSPGYPRGKAVWYSKEGVSLDSERVELTYDEENPFQGHTYTCEGLSALGRNFGSTLEITTECSP